MNAQRWLQGKVVAQRRWTSTLFSLQVDADLPPFDAGQFTKLALEIDGELVARPYSFVNAPGCTPHEFYCAIVPGGPLSPRLALLSDGDAILLAPAPAGFLVLSEVPDADTLWLLATGTGVGPFLSILGGDVVWQRFQKVVLVYAARRVEDLAYGDWLTAIQAARGAQLRVVRMLSREVAPCFLQGRIPQAIDEGALERVTGVALQAATAQVMLCGNPGMVADATAALRQRGMKKHRRRDPGQITVENYW